MSNVISMRPSTGAEIEIITYLAVRRGGITIGYVNQLGESGGGTVVDADGEFIGIAFNRDQAIGLLTRHAPAPGPSAA